MITRPTHSVVSRRLVLAGGVAVTAMGLASCGGSEAPVDDQGRVRIRFATDWRAQAEHGGFYQAEAAGLYRAAGLEVALTTGGPQINPAQLLLGGRDGETVPQLDAAAIPSAAAAAATGTPARPRATDTVCRRSVLTGRYTTM
jgi:ABC-type nitrate/sulfonate/bicarbonate transport system substrate-binding protein